MIDIYRKTGIISGLILVISLLGCSKLFSGVKGEAPPVAESWFVVKVSDGDTVKVRQSNGEEMNVRFCGIDSPEKSQPLGKESKANLQRLVNEAEGWVMVVPVETDRFGRTVAELFTSVQGQERSLNEEQLSSGYAYLYRKYGDKCPNKQAFATAEAIAQQKNLGVWAEPGLEKPWDFRKRQREKD